MSARTALHTAVCGLFCMLLSTRGFTVVGDENDLATWMNSTLPSGPPNVHVANLYEVVYPIESWAGVGDWNPEAGWKYDDTGNDRGSAWRNINYDDSFWGNGDANFSIIGPTETWTQLMPGRSCYYFRKKFQVWEGYPIAIFVLRVWYSDGIIVYLDGVEKYRVNLP